MGAKNCYTIGFVCAPELEEERSKVTPDKKTAVGDAAAACHEGFKGGFGTWETSVFILVTTGVGSGDLAGSTIDGCPLGGIHGTAAGYAVFEVVAGGITVSA